MYIPRMNGTDYLLGRNKCSELIYGKVDSMFPTQGLKKRYTTHKRYEPAGFRLGCDPAPDKILEMTILRVLWRTVEISACYNTRNPPYYVGFHISNWVIDFGSCDNGIRG